MMLLTDFIKGLNQTDRNALRRLLNQVSEAVTPDPTNAGNVIQGDKYEFTITIRARNFSKLLDVDPAIDPDCIATSGLQTGPKNRLRKMGVLKFSDLANITRSRLLLERNLGKMGIQQIEWQMGERGLQFAPEPLDNE
jgi:DNA-directed RNA polymerase alpha subunit